MFSNVCLVSVKRHLHILTYYYYDHLPSKHAALRGEGKDWLAYSVRIMCPSTATLVSVSKHYKNITQNVGPIGIQNRYNCHVYGALLYVVRIRFHRAWEAIQLRPKLLKVNPKLS